MGKLYNKLAKAKYLNNYDPEYLLETYKRLSTLYDNKEIPFVNIGLLDETQVKTQFDYNTKVFSIVFECSRPNRVNKKFPLAIDWIINLISLPTNLLYKVMYIKKTCNFTKFHRTHAGFSLAYLKIIDFIDNRIQEVLNNNEQIKRFEIYGWSYGGAMATLCHGYISEKYNTIEDLNQPNSLITLTIGAPRTFFKIPFDFIKIKPWLDLKKNYQNIYLFSNANDIVTKVPFKFMLFSHIMPRVILEKPFNFIKVFRPDIYHQKSRYDELIINKLTQEVLKKKEAEIPSIPPENVEITE